MHLVVMNDTKEIAALLSKLIIGLIRKKPHTVLGLATGSSPIPTYQLLVEDHQKNKTDWSNVTSFNLDEYVGLNQENKNSYHYFMNEHLFNYVNINKSHIFIPSGQGSPNKNAQEYEALIDKHGPIDLQILGLGENGHIGFNEPGSDDATLTRVVDLTANTINANKRFFNDDIHQVPKQAITMGIATILKAISIVVIATGQHKAKAVRALVQGEISSDWPCTYLQRHANVLVVIDKDASSLLDKTKIKEHR